MQRIKSFEVDHTKLEKGLYLSRIDEDIATYDLRMVKPNVPPFLENAGAHTFEHLMATYLRNSEYGKNVIYIGPMGCRTGFYLLFRDLPAKAVIDLIKSALEFISRYHGEIPGSTKAECGNYLEHDLPKAKLYAKDMEDVLANWQCDDLQYDV
ncbi:MAG: S-ribosylhomocysteine lyase [Clostridia bacterium]|nr:S-ribosylhomocysteine lyase [Clostridia bacterium]